MTINLDKSFDFFLFIKINLLTVFLMLTGVPQEQLPLQVLFSTQKHGRR